MRIAPARLARHLGLPSGAPLSDQWTALIEETQAWCNEHLRPWLTTRRLAISEIAGETVSLERQVGLRGERLAEGLRGATAHAVIVAAISVGRRLDPEIARCWSTGRPDRALALHATGASLVETMRDVLWLRLRKSLGGAGITVLPHLSPGYDGWPLSDQATLYALTSGSAGPLELLASGGLKPLHSTLVLFGLTAARDIAADQEYWEQLSGDRRDVANAPIGAFWDVEKRFAVSGSDRPAGGRVARDHLEDRRALATFRVHGPTCGKLGLAYELDCSVELERDGDHDWIIVSTSCQPAGTQGITGTCAYRQRPDFSRILAASGPGGVRMAAAIDPPADPPSFVCPCRAAGRRHIWRAALAAISCQIARHPKTSIGAR